MSKRNRLVVSVALVIGIVGGWTAGDIVSGNGGGESPGTTMVPATSAPIAPNDRPPFDIHVDCGGRIDELTPEQIRACL